MFDSRLAAVVALLFALGVLAPSAPESDHHEHPGVTDASPDDLSHHHGDADDHHESPDSPCHHHVIHCDCSVGFAVPAVVEFSAGLETASTAHPQLISLAIPPFASAIFHVPIA